MTEQKAVYALSISGRLTLEMHSLNNEGGEGNQTMTRTVAIVTPDGNVHKVNAISGDMFKHIQAEHYYLLAKEGRLPLCRGCQVFDAARILADKEFLNNLPKTDEDVLNQLLSYCALDDTEGTLIARGSRSIPRKSIAEFAWVVGIPEKVRTESYFHVRYARERGSEEATDQPIFHRPASSGVYASVATFEIARIGFNDVSQTYAIDAEERQRRYETFLKSVMYTYIEPSGAMRGTQNPHIHAFEGVITISYGVMPAPTISPLADEYADQIARIAQNLDPEGTVLEVKRFQNMAEFTEMMQGILQNTRPYTLFAS
ncbi:MAG: DevR family CRISPR-associated autoregulator [Ardenticatenia bacterium]|nr:MAG: DevR family CRISPR-associated autoregulator [Ardenticatenia bacterium]